MTYGKFVAAKDCLALQLDFLARAAAAGGGKPYLEYIHVEPSESGLSGVATDGVRLHFIETLSFAREVGLFPGYWHVLRGQSRKNPRRDVWITRIEDNETINWGEYPGWRKILPAEKPQYETTLRGFALDEPMLYNTLAHSDSVEKLIRNFPEFTLLSLNYLQDLGSGIWKVEWYGPEKAVKFTGAGRLALIMPRSNNEEANNG